MSSEICDLTLPAHDPNITKPRGLLPVPPFVEGSIAQDRARMEQYYTDEFAQKCRNYNTLRYWYEGHYIAWRETPPISSRSSPSCESVRPSPMSSAP